METTGSAPKNSLQDAQDAREPRAIDSLCPSPRKQESPALPPGRASLTTLHAQDARPSAQNQPNLHALLDNTWTFVTYCVRGEMCHE